MITLPSEGFEGRVIEISVEALVEVAKEKIAKAHMCFLPDNLEFLKAGGRVSNAAYMGAKILNGTKAGDLAVQAWSSDDLAVNKTAVQQYNLPISEEIINKANQTL